MSRDKLRLSDYLTHIVEAVDRIHRYTAGMSRDEFVVNELVRDAVIRNIEVIGEASNNIDKQYAEFAEAHSDLPLSREGFGDKWAYDVPAEMLKNPADPWQVLLDFMSYCRVVEPPNISRGLFS